ncbi:class I SAM-dependent methyltransferase [Candidatus Babeliales bacterium]|nr:class I SAM-dependent methyltransferase [Candidatus Babeliales bacterium]
MYIQGAYVYEGITVELYDLWFGSEPHEDQAFYEHFIRHGDGLALEIGSGTGRLLLPYLRSNLEVHGVEPSAQMMGVCQEKAEQFGLQPTIYQQYMQSLKIPHSYKTIFIPLCTFQLLVSRQEVLEALRRFYVHLEQDGRLMISLFMPTLQMLTAEQGVWSVRRATTRVEDNAHVVLSEAIQRNHFEQIETKWLKYEVYKNSQLAASYVKTMQLRWYSWHEFKMIIEKVGFRNVFMYGNYTHHEACEKNEVIVFSMQK